MIKFSWDDSGFKKLKRNLESVDGQKISFPELFNPSFMARHTKHATIEGLFDISGFDVNSPEDFAAIPDDEWEAVIRRETSFASWEEMQRVAGAEWMKRKLDLK